MAYNQTFETGDFAAILTDILGGTGVAVLQYLALIILVVVLVWGARKLRRR